MFSDDQRLRWTQSPKRIVGSMFPLSVSVSQDPGNDSIFPPLEKENDQLKSAFWEGYVSSEEGKGLVRDLRTKNVLRYSGGDEPASWVGGGRSTKYTSHFTLHKQPSIPKKHLLPDSHVLPLRLRQDPWRNQLFQEKFPQESRRRPCCILECLSGR